MSYAFHQSEDDADAGKTEVPSKDNGWLGVRRVVRPHSGNDAEDAPRLVRQHAAPSVRRCECGERIARDSDTGKCKRCWMGLRPSGRVKPEDGDFAVGDTVEWMPGRSMPTSVLRHGVVVRLGPIRVTFRDANGTLHTVDRLSLRIAK